MNLSFSSFINKDTSSTSILVVFLCVVIGILSHANQRSQDVLHHMEGFQSFPRVICPGCFSYLFLGFLMLKIQLKELKNKPKNTSSFR